MFAHIKEALGHYLLGLSTLHEGAFPGWKADEDYPGYMIRIDPPVVMRAPYHIVCAFPSETVLDAIWHLSRKVKTLPTSVLCLSGSAAIMKSSISICDIDFCEYIKGKPDDMAKALSAKMAAGSDLFFRSIRVGSEKADPSFKQADVQAKLQSMSANDPERSHAKIDFVGKPEGLRPSDISNVIIFCDKNWHSASLQRSFAAQEAHLDPIAVVPNILCEPFEMGRYVEFLLSEATAYGAKGDFAKALKRCLSLARLCFLSAKSEEITRFITDSPEFLEREIKAIDDLITELGASSRNSGEWIDELKWARLDLDHYLGKARLRSRRETIEGFTKRMIMTLDSALSGEDLRAA